MIDRRYDRRIPLQIKVLVEEEGALKTYQSLNISRGGLFLETEAPKTIDTIIKMELVFSDQERLSMDGKVVWVSYPHQSSSYVPGMGIKFIELNSEKVEKLGEIIGRYLKRDIEVSENIYYPLNERIIVTSEDMYDQQAELMVSFAGLGIKEAVDHVRYVLDRCDEKLRTEYEKFQDSISFGESLKILLGTTYGFLKKESFPVKVFFFCNNQDIMIFEKVKKEIFES